MIIYRLKIFTHSAAQTVKLGAQLGKYLRAGDVLGLTGTLGSGKTTLVQGIAAGLKVERKKYLNSPSFVLIKEYNGKIPIFHFDLYRLDNIRDIEYLGVQEYLFDSGVCVIEWAERLKSLLPDYLQINLKIKGVNKRELSLTPKSRRYAELLKRLLKVVVSEDTSVRYVE